MRILRLGITLLFALVLVIYVLFRIQQLNVDRTYPEITVDSDMLYVTIDATREELLSGVAAYDEKDGDLTHKIIVESISRFKEPGVSIIKYAVCDNDNHVSSVKRKLTYTNYAPPKFTLSDSLVFGVSQNINIRNILGATDLIDGDISGKVIITADEYASNVEGVFYISAKAANSKGDMIALQLPVYVEEMSLSAPKIDLREYLVYVRCGETYRVSDNVRSARDAQDTDLRSYVQIDTNLDTNTPGVYEAHYRVTDASGRTGHEILTIIVDE